MAFGIETYRQNGSASLGLSSATLFFIEALTVTPTTNYVSKTYMNVPSGALVVMCGAGAASIGTEFVTGDDGSGHATLSWRKENTIYNNDSTTSNLLVFATDLINNNLYGVSILNSNSKPLVDIVYPVPQHAYTTYPDPRPYNVSTLYDGSKYSSHSIVISQPFARNLSNRMVLVNLPDSTVSNAWYGINSFVQPLNSYQAQTFDLELTLDIIRPNPNAAYDVPSIHLVALDNPVSSESTYGIQCFDGNGALVYDSNSENLVFTSSPSIVYSRSIQSMPIGNNTGVFIPYCAMYERTETTWKAWQGVFQRKGSTIYYVLYKTLDGGNPNQISPNNIQDGSTSSFTSFIDISNLNPGTLPGVVI